jgi:soluble lytic murein transglycosylase
VRRVSLWVITISILLQANEAPAVAATPAPQTTGTPLSILKESVEGRDWKKVEALVSPDTPDPLSQLLRARALFEQDRWESVLQFPKITDERFASYLDYLQLSSAHQSKKHEQVIAWKLSEDLPLSMIQSGHFMQSQSLIALERWPLAKDSLREFLKKYPRSSLRSDVLLELAQVEWRLENKFEALHLYEEVYSQYPLADPNDTASDALRAAGRFQELDAGVHLLRADQLKRSALFSKGVEELKKLQTLVPKKDRAKIDLALAGLEFARRDYAKSEALAKAALKDKNIDPNLKSDWQSLLAFSHARQGEYDSARPIYDELLKSKLNSWEKEMITLRLALMALDDKNFEDSRKHFKSLRVDFLKGRYHETAHWFEAWSIYQIELGKRRLDPKYQYNSEEIENAIELLNRLPKLPEGERLHAQALYWQAQLFDLLKEETQKTKAQQKLLKDWAASFHAQLNQPKPFDFLDFKSVDISDEVYEKRPAPALMSDQSFQAVSWKRVEAFASIGLSNWARFELERFREGLGSKNEALKNAIAHRLRDLGDWFDLVSYARMEFEFSLEDLKVDDPIVRFHYPQAYTLDVLRAAKEFEVSPFLVWGVMREESRFQADVLSGAGAVGLLQLMPSLGDRIAKALKEKPMGRRGLTDSSRNIRYGTFHLRELINRVQGLKVPEEFKYPLVVASYNAGFGPVKKWVEEIGVERVDTFIESIPYTETRNYVKRVLQSSNVYYRIYGEKIRALSKSKEEKKL